MIALIVASILATVVGLGTVGYVMYPEYKDPNFTRTDKKSGKEYRVSTTPWAWAAFLGGWVIISIMNILMNNHEFIPEFIFNFGNVIFVFTPLTIWAIRSKHHMDKSTTRRKVHLILSHLIPLLIIFLGVVGNIIAITMLDSVMRMGYM